MRATLLVSALAFSATAVFCATDWQAAGRAWWAHVEYLASDSLAGRNVGSPGFERAAQYVAREFKGAGLQAAGSNGYFQNVAFTETSLDAAQSHLSLACRGKAQTVPIPGEAYLGYSPDSGPHINAPLVFAGYGLVIPEAHYDDLRGLPLKGAIAVYLTGGPSSIDGNLRSHYSSTEERWRALRAAGAIGTIAVANPQSMEMSWARLTASWGMPHMTLADPALDPSRGRAFSAGWNPAQADALFVASGHSFAEVLAAAHSHQPLPRFPLACSVDATVKTASRPVTSKNVAGIRAGSDPQFAHQYVVISAHLDHLGTGKPVKGDSIYNGAMDDASGIASLIEIAKALDRAHVQTKRSILFLAVTAEEKGELGSHWFAAHPTVTGTLVADLNMDMYLPLFPLHWLEVQGLNESTLGTDIRAVASAAGVKVQADKEPEHNRFIRSDQYSFIKKGVPALAFKFGYLSGTPEEKVFKNWYATRYHGVRDDVSQPVDKAAAARFNSILEQLAIRVADAPEPPHWNANSFFRRFEHSPE